MNVSHHFDQWLSPTLVSMEIHTVLYFLCRWTGCHLFPQPGSPGFGSSAVTHNLTAVVTVSTGFIFQLNLLMRLQRAHRSWIHVPDSSMLNKQILIWHQGVLLRFPHESALLFMLSFQCRGSCKRRFLFTGTIRHHLPLKPTGTSLISRLSQTI